jgi:WD40 repeat protein
MWLTGAPGVGKSTIAAWLRNHRSQIVVSHFCDIGSEETRNPTKFALSLVFQLSVHLPEYEKAVAKYLRRKPRFQEDSSWLEYVDLEDLIVQGYDHACTLVDELLVDAYHPNLPEPPHPMVVLIDALDEATFQGANEIARILHHCVGKAPRWLRFLITSRRDREVVAALRMLSARELDMSREENLQDLQDYLTREVPGVRPAQIGEILGRSEGAFLYVDLLQESLRVGHLGSDRLDESPRGLGSAYHLFFTRQFGGYLYRYGDKVKPLLQPLLAAFEPPTTTFLKRLCGITSDAELDRRLSGLRLLFPTKCERGSTTVRCFHRSLRDWITSSEDAGRYAIDVPEGHRALVEQGWQEFGQGPEAMDDYILQWLPSHLRAVGDRARLAGLLGEFRYLMEKARRGQVEQLLQDFRDLPQELAGPGGPLEGAASFFRENAYALRGGSEVWPAHKVLLQMAVEHADDSSLSQGAERWIADGHCDWAWLRRAPRPTHVPRDPCIAVLDGRTGEIGGALSLPDGRLLSWPSGMPRGRQEVLLLWDGQSGELPDDCPACPECGVSDAVALPDGRVLLWDWADRTWLWDGQSGTELVALIKPWTLLDGVRELPLPDGRLLFNHSDRALLRLDSRSRMCMKTSRSAVLLVLTDGRRLEQSGDSRIPVMELRDGNGNGNSWGALPHTRSVGGALALPDGRLLTWSDDDLRLWHSQELEAGSRSDLRCLAILHGHVKEVRGALALPSGCLLSWSDDMTLRLWDGQSGKPLEVLHGHTSAVSGALALPRGRLLSWAGRDLRLWHSQNGKLVAVLEGHTGYVRGTSALPDGRLLSWSDDSTMRLWDSLDGTCLGVLEGHAGPVLGALSLSDGRLLSWSKDGTLRLWDSLNTECLTVPERHADVVLGTLLLPDGRLLSWSKDSTLRLWDGQSGKCRSVLRGHAQAVEGALALPDGHLLSWTHSEMSDDNDFRLWDGQSGRLLDMVLEDEASKAHPDWVLARAAWKPSGRSVGEFRASSAHDYTVHLYHGVEPGTVAMWCARARVMSSGLIMPDGTLVAGLTSGDVCFLKLHHGTRRLTIAELGALLPKQ